MKMHCCSELEYQVTESDERLVKFSADTRSYRFFLHGPSEGSYRALKFCPWCGSKLPKELDEEWGELLEKEYGLEDPGWMKTEDLPKEFQTDEWWRKRGL